MTSRGLSSIDLGVLGLAPMRGRRYAMGIAVDARTARKKIENTFTDHSYALIGDMQVGTITPKEQVKTTSVSHMMC